MAQSWDNKENEIILALIRGENHVRGLAKETGIPRMTVSRALGKLVQENALDFKTEGRNKVFYLRKTLQAKNYVFNAERYKLIKLVKQYPELNVIIDDILKNCKEQLIVLFGSYAKGIAKKDSDVDIYIETTDRKVKETVEAVHSKISVKIGGFDTDSLLIKEIIKNHVILRGVEEFYGKTKFFE